MPSRGRGLASVAHPEGIAPNSVELSDCAWYSDLSGDVGALKLPRGVTAERPTVNTGGRENFTFDLTVSSPDLEFGDPGFVVGDPWLWTWVANYNRANPATNVNGTGSEVQALTLYKGSTYTFNNYTVGHKLWLRHTAKTDSNDPENVNLVDGATNNGAIRTVGEVAPGSVVWTIPDDYAYSSVFVQHSQTGMVNEVTVADPPTETLGYLRLNTDPNAVNIEAYTGSGWKTIPFSDEAGGVKEHPTGTLTTDDFGLITDGTVTPADWGVITDSNTSGNENWEELILTAFLESGSLSVNDDSALVVHDGATGGGIPMLKADMSNVSDARVASTTIMRKTGSQTLIGTGVSGSNTSRVAFPTSVINGITGISFEDSNARIRFSKDLQAAWLKFTLRFNPNVNCTVELWKNNSKIADASFNAQANFTNTFFYLEQAAFNDYFEIRCYNSSGSNITINSNEILTIEFLGS